MKLLLLILCFAAAAISQTPATPKLKHITWSDQPACGTRFQVPEEDKIECDLVIANGRRISILEHNGIIVAAIYGDDGDHVVLNTLIFNTAGRRILVEPERFALLHYRKEADAATQQTLAVERAIDPSDIAKKIQRSAMWANVFTALGAAAQTRESTLEARTNTGLVITGTETTPDYAARNRAAAANAQRSSNAQARADAVRDGALYANTVFDGQKVGGYVYFKRNKKAGYTEIGMIFEGSVYIFPLRKG
jgi:hypothetical protein